MLSRIVRRTRAPLLKNWNEPFAHIVQHRPFYDTASIIAFGESVGKPLVQVIQDSPTAQAGLARAAELAVENGLQKFADFSNESDEKLKKIVRDARFQSRPEMLVDILPSRVETKTALLEKVVQLIGTDQALLMVSGPKSSGKSVLAYQVATELNRRPGYQCLWMEAPPKEEAFKEQWLWQMGLSMDQRSGLTFEHLGDVLAGIRNDIKVVDVAGHEGDFHGGTDLYVKKSVQTVVFVDAMRADYDYMQRLLWLAVRHSGLGNIMYVLIASDAADSYRVTANFETRCKHFEIQPFTEQQMKEFIATALEKNGVVAVDDGALSDIQKTVMEQTYQATNAFDFIRDGVKDGTFSHDAMVASAKKFVRGFSMYVEGVLDEDGWSYEEYGEYVTAFRDVKKMSRRDFRMKFGSPKPLIRRNFAYQDEYNVHLMPEFIHALQFMVEGDPEEKVKQ